MSLIAASALAVPHRLVPTDLAIDAGEIVALIGPNGSGKTSLLRALVGAEPRASGTVLLGGNPLTALAPAQRARRVAFLPTSRDLAWPIPARDLVRFSPAPIADARVDGLLHLIELADKADRPADRLSTGERTRLLFARAIAAQPPLWLLDEPFANLDPYWVLRLATALDQHRDDAGGALVALHDLALLSRFDRVLMIDGGRIVADAPPPDILASLAFRSLFRLSADQAQAIAGGRRSSP